MAGKRTALWTADMSRLDGQAIVTRRVVRSLGNAISFRWEYRPGRGLQVLSSLGMALSVWARAWVSGVDQVYLVCSRSTLGFLRDIPALSLAFFGVRVVVHLHGADLLLLCQRPFVGRLARTLYSKCEVIVPSAHLIDEVRSIPVRKVHLCENYIEEGGGPITASPPGSPLVVLWNSNVMASKGFRQVAEAVELARANGLAIRFVVIGRVIGDAEASANDMQRLLDLIDEVDENIIWGPVSQKRVQELLRECDVVVLASEMECQPLAIIEAMGAARQVIVTDIPSLRATTEGYPALFVQRNPSSVAEALFQAAETDEDKRSDLAKAAEVARVRFSNSRFETAIREILTGQLKAQ